MRFDLCIPAYNEAGIVLDTLKTLISHLNKLEGIEWEILVAENGSTDGTDTVIEQAGLPQVKVVKIMGRGKGRAIKAAAAVSTADYFGFIDVDLSADPAAIPELLKALSGGANIAVGSRLLNSSVKRGYMRTISSRLFNWYANLCLKLPVHDIQCGLKIMDKKAKAVLISCVEDTWFLDIEFLAKSHAAGFSIQEIPITWTEFMYKNRKSKLKVLSDGYAGIQAIRRIAKK